MAGIIDGEGTVTLTRTHRGENRRPLVSISSTESPLLLYVQSVIGVGRITNKVCSRPHHTPSFAYVVARERFENRFFAISIRAPSKKSEALTGNHRSPLSLIPTG